MLQGHQSSLQHHWRDVFVHIQPSCAAAQVWSNGITPFMHLCFQGCLMGHNWLHTPHFRLLDESIVLEGSWQAMSWVSQMPGGGGGWGEGGFVLQHSGQA